MNRRHLFTWASALLLSSSLLSAPAAWAQNVEAPDALVKRLSTELLDTIRSDPSLKAGDANRVMAIVNDKVMPHVNFARMTASTIGPAWRDATPTQRQQLQDAFKNLLVRTYAGALKQVGNQTLAVRPLRASPSDTEVVVNSEMQGGQGGPIQLDYRMQKMADGWKVYDINVMGVWMADSYRGQFAQAISSSGIDGLIKQLNDQARAAGKAS
ncbi:MAG: putative phospholipid-binding protein MlaC [Paracidovorax wautersii]|uniref:Putative phospholipid-binding protein MlaC n=1 Tax=Paracidovorax wautersii TaxID=1177982 RepID=A0A7V8JRP7_9BURK|nr:MAG: putative phospholipid-binding protein MlaC [Paracidovorax wautersii]